MSVPTPQGRRIEIAHESLLKNWPRLVRWQMQDAEGAQLRDELRQAAQMWDQHGRSADLLWTGTAHREYQLWREHYPGRLSELEESFARAMDARQNQRKRHVRLAVAALLSFLLAVIMVITVLWRESAEAGRRAELAAARAEVEAQRSEASKLLALGQAVLKDDPTAALAYVLESLTLADTPEGRRFAVEILWRSPAAMVSPEGPGTPWGISFSPDGKWIGAGYWSGYPQLYSAVGELPVTLPLPQGRGKEGQEAISAIGFSPDGSRVFAYRNSNVGEPGEIGVWSLPERKLVTTIAIAPDKLFAPAFGREEILVLVAPRDFQGSEEPVLLRRINQHGEEASSFPIRSHTAVAFGASRTMLATGFGKRLLLHRFDESALQTTLVGEHPAHFRNGPVFDPNGRFLAAGDEGGNVALWSMARPGTVRWMQKNAMQTSLGMGVSADGSLLCLAAGTGARLWDLSGVTAAEPLTLPRIEGQISSCGLHPSNQWAATGRGRRIALWNLKQPRMRVLSSHEGGAARVAFSPDSRFLYSIGAQDGKVLRWPLQGSYQDAEQVMFATEPSWGWGISVAPGNDFLIATTKRSSWKVPLDGEAPVRLNIPPTIPGPAIAPDGRHLAISCLCAIPGLTIYDMETGESRELGSPTDGQVTGWGYDAFGRLVVTRGGRLQVWQERSDQPLTLIESGAEGLVLTADRRQALVSAQGRATLVDLQTGATSIPSWDLNILRGFIAEDIQEPSCALGPGVAAEVTADGLVRAGRLDGGEPHLLYGHEGTLGEVKVSPDGRWIAAGSPDGIYLWPVPDSDSPPLHTLPYEELLAKLRSLTNLRAFADPDQAAGYRIDVDDSAWHGWQQVPEW